MTTSPYRHLKHDWAPAHGDWPPVPQQTEYQQRIDAEAERWGIAKDRHRGLSRSSDSRWLGHVFAPQLHY